MVTIIITLLFKSFISVKLIIIYIYNLNQFVMAELINQTYQKKTDKEHILDNEDTYTGSMEISDNSTYIFNDGKIVEENNKNDTRII